MAGLSVTALQWSQESRLGFKRNGGALRNEAFVGGQMTPPRLAPNGKPPSHQLTVAAQEKQVEFCSEVLVDV